MKDPLIDWLEKYYKKGKDIPCNNSLNTTTGSVRHKTPRNRSSSSEPKSTKNDDYNFTTHIMKQGTVFEEKILMLLEENFGKGRIAKINGERGPRDPKKVSQTLNAMKKGYPIIHSGVLHNHKNKTFGIPDLLVRSDWLKYLVRDCPRCFQNGIETKKAKKLFGNYHYVVIDIKYSRRKKVDRGKICTEDIELALNFQKKKFC